MKKVPVRLSDKVATLIRRAVNSSGSYDPNDCMFMFEEELTIKQADQAHAFLTWVHENGKKFGHNILEVYAEFTVKGVDVYNRILDEGNARDQAVGNFDISTIKVTMRETPPPKAR